MAYPNPPKTWSAGAVLTAAQLNAELRDALNIIIPTASTTLAWGSTTPTFTQSATITKTVTYAKVFQIGKVVIYQFNLAATSSGTANNAVTVGLPVTAATAGTREIGSGHIFDTSANTNYPANIVMASTTTIQFLDNTQGTTSVLLGQTGAAFSAAIASGDNVAGCVIYEAA